MVIKYGLRKEEVLGLRWDAINFDKRFIEIRRTRTKSKLVYDFDTVKSKNSYRILPMLDSIESILLKIKNDQIKNNIYSEKGYVFCWCLDSDNEKNGEPYRPDYINKIFNELL